MSQRDSTNGQTRLIVNVCVFIVLGFVFKAVPDAKKYAGFGKNFCACDAGLGTLFVMFIGIYKGFIYGIVFDQIVLYLMSQIDRAYTGAT